MTSVAGFTTLLSLNPGFAGTLQVSPIGIEVGQGIAATTENLENKGTSIINGQARIYTWASKDGKDYLTPTTDVVARPATSHIEPGRRAPLRIVRLPTEPIASEEGNRHIITELTQHADPPAAPTTLRQRHPTTA